MVAQSSLPLASYDQIAYQLTNGFWPDDAVHHFLLGADHVVTVNLSGLETVAQTLARAALDLWSDVSGLKFVETLANAQIMFDDDDPTLRPVANTNITVDGAGNIVQSAVHITQSWVNFYGSSLTSYSLQAYVHEIGHALGLGHAGDYNGQIASDNAGMLFQNDAWSTSVMSYYGQNKNNYFTLLKFSNLFVSTPMMADIIAIQNIYGIVPDTRVGDTVYGFNTNSDRGIYNAGLYATAAYTIFDGGGIDTLDYSGFSAAQKIDLTPESFSNIGGKIGNVAIARGVTIENAIGGSGADSIYGNGADNVLTGNSGNDSLFGGLGSDTLIGGAGLDTLDGGAGADRMEGGADSDTYIVDDTGDQVVELANQGTDLVKASASFTLGANVENLTLTGAGAIDGGGNELVNKLTGNAAANVLRGFGGNDTIDGGTGADAMYGGLGDDSFIVDNSGDQVIELANEGIDLVKASASFTLGTNVENLTLTGADAIDGGGNDLINKLVGNAAANALYGFGGNDAIDGGLGADTMHGGLGDDSFTVDNAADQVIELFNEGTDIVKASVSFTLGANVENLTLTGANAIDGSGNDLINKLVGNAAANALYGFDGNDAIDGGLGADTMYGGLGNDSFTVDNTGDQVIELFNEGSDTVRSSVSFTLGANLEKLTLTGTGAIDGVGNELVNTLTGNAADNLLQGLGGNDILAGGDGNDRLIGGAGADTLTGGNGGDYFVFDSLSIADKETIKDFVVGQDRIDLSSAVFATLGAAGDLSASAFAIGSAATTSSQHLIYNSATGALYYDSDGVGGAGQVQIGVFTTHPTLSAGDFHVF